MRILSRFRFRTDRPVTVRSVRQAKAALVIAVDLETSGVVRDRAWAHRYYRAVADFCTAGRAEPQGRIAELLGRARAGVERTGHARRAVFASIIRAEPLEVLELEQAVDDTVVDLQALIEQYHRSGSVSALAPIPPLAVRLEALTGALASARADDYDDPTRWPLAA